MLHLVGNISKVVVVVVVVVVIVIVIVIIIIIIIIIAIDSFMKSVFSTQLVNVEYFNCLGSMTTYDARGTCEIKSRICMAKANFNKKTFHWQIGLKFKEETGKILHLEYSFVWCRNWDTLESISEIAGKF